MHSDRVPIGSPCSVDWGAMTGDDRRRFCGQCNKHVHDLSAMREREAKALLATGDKLCVRYTVKPDGTMRHRPTRRMQLLAMGAALLSGAQAYASTAPAPAPGPDDGPGVIERVVRRIAAWAEGADATEGAPIAEATPQPTQPQPTPTTQPEPPDERVTMGDYIDPGPPPPPPPPPPPVRMGGLRPSPPTTPQPPPLPAVPPGQSVIPEVEAALRDQE